MILKRKEGTEQEGIASLLIHKAKGQGTLKIKFHVSQTFNPK